MTTYDIIELLRSDNSRLFKEQVLRDHLLNTTLHQVFDYALNPRKQFYIKKIPTYSFVELKYSLSKVWLTLDRLSAREVTGHAAIAELKDVLEHLDPADAKILELIIQKDLKCGVSTSTVNKIFPGMIPETPYQRCSLLKDMKKDKIDWEAGLISQEKLDGMFANIHIPKVQPVEILSRNGSSFPLDHFKHIIEDLSKRDLGYVYHGELVVSKDGVILPREIGNGMMNSVLQTGEFDSEQYKIVFITWDVVADEEFFERKESSEPYNVRLDFLKSQIPEDTYDVKLCPTKIVYSYAEAKQHYKDLALQGKEGTILKSPSTIWKDGTSRQMWKFKVEAEIELRVKGYNEGKGKNKDLFGSIIFESEDGILEVNVSGFSDDQRKEISDNREKYLEAIGTVIFNSIMKSEGKKPSLFLPRFGYFRLDKDTANTFQEIEDIFESVLNGDE